MAGRTPPVAAGSADRECHSIQYGHYRCVNALCKAVTSNEIHFFCSDYTPSVLLHNTVSSTSKFIVLRVGIPAYTMYKLAV